MEKKIVIQTVGGVAKEENLFALTTHVMPNTCVLENEEPYPGYHHHLPGGSKPVSVFLLTKKKYSAEKILRLQQNIRKYFGHPFDAVPGTICINNYTFPCIRIRDLDNYDRIEDLQKSFFAEGVRFHKKKNITGPAVIQLKKHFNIEKMDEGIYKDLDDAAMFYVGIPHQLSWQMFHQVTRAVRNNIEKETANFDAALAAIYTREILDVVRIYSSEADLDTLKLIQSRYNEEIRRIQ
jgi:hypothetical protein